MKLARRALFICTFLSFVFFLEHQASANGCDQVYNQDGVALLKPDGSLVCLSDTTTEPHSPNGQQICEKAFDEDAKPYLTYHNDGSINPSPHFYCIDDPNAPANEESTLQYFDDENINPLALPVAGLPHNIPSPSYQPPGGGLCGNGFLDPGEQCDFGPNETENVPAYNPSTQDFYEDEVGNPITIIGNDDNLSNWCRTTCMLPTFGDGVVDFNFGETIGPNGEEMMLDPAEWMAEASLFRNDPMEYFAAFAPEDPQDPPYDPNDLPVCDIQTHMCVPQSLASFGSIVGCFDDSDCGHMECSGLQCLRVAGAGDDLCSEATAEEDCGHLECDNLACVAVAGEGDDLCGKDEDCWGKACSKKSATCTYVKIEPSSSTCSVDDDCVGIGPGGGGGGSGGGGGGGSGGGSNPPGDPYTNVGNVGIPYYPPVEPEDPCDNRGWQWCDETFGTCTASLSQFCNHPDTKCHIVCTDLYPHYKYWATNYQIYLSKALAMKAGEHVGGAIQLGGWKRYSRFNSNLVCDEESWDGHDDQEFADSVKAYYHNHGRTVDNESGGRKSLLGWSSIYPTCIEKRPDGYFNHRMWNMRTGIAYEPVPRCVLDTITEGLGTGSDCDQSWKTAQEKALTDFACVEALKDADFFCDTLCASDGYVMPYDEIVEDSKKQSLINKISEAIRVPPMDASWRGLKGNANVSLLSFFWVPTETGQFKLTLKFGMLLGPVL